MKFFKTFMAALLAVLAGTVILWILAIGILSGISASLGRKALTVHPKSVLTIDLGSTIVDSPGAKGAGFNLSNLSFIPSNSILEVLDAIEIAASDNNIEGIYLNFKGRGTMGVAHAEEIRAAVEKFKESGKFVVAYNENYSQLGYYLCSVADHTYIHPEGMLDWRGLSAQVMFYKGLLEKLDIQVEILRHGTFKSAVEPYMSDKMSPANRLQTETYVNSMWNMLLDDISASRGISKADLQRCAETLAIRSSGDAKRLSFVDDVLYEDQVMDILSGLINGEEMGELSAEARDNENEETVSSINTTKVKSISLHDYIRASSLTGKRISKNKVAIIYADGGIISGASDLQNAGSETVSKQLAKARKDDGVKAVVFRVNSPGGSALASDVMWREVELLRQEKPVVVSMGNYAASGGYYISCNADVILADRSTVTGSIGVFGMIPNLEKTFRNKLGITIDGVSTAPYANLGSTFNPMQPAERDFLMAQIENVYKTFVGHVSAGRNMTFEDVDKIGQGRVWLGVDAQPIGLVDGFGGLSDAIALAADRAGVGSDFRVYEIVESPNPLQMFMDLFVSSASVKMSSELGEAFRYYNYINSMVSEEPQVQARMPYMVEFR